MVESYYYQSNEFAEHVLAIFKGISFLNFSGIEGHIRALSVMNFFSSFLGCYFSYLPDQLNLLIIMVLFLIEQLN